MSFADVVIILCASYLYLFLIGLAIVCFSFQPIIRQRIIVIQSAILLLLVYLVTKVAAYFYFDPRPFVAGHFQPFIAHAPDNGFPSDHMLICSGIAAILFRYNRKMGIAAWIIALIVGVARVLAGVHHWIDIVGSVLIVLFAIWAINKYIMPWLAKIGIYKRLFKI